jgi:hypothetical protein
VFVASSETLLLLHLFRHSVSLMLKVRGIREYVSSSQVAIKKFLTHFLSNRKIENNSHVTVIDFTILTSVLFLHIVGYTKGVFFKLLDDGSRNTIANVFWLDCRNQSFEKESRFSWTVLKLSNIASLGTIFLRVERLFRKISLSRVEQ